jgi:hypothetical protein
MAYHKLTSSPMSGAMSAPKLDARVDMKHETQEVYEQEDSYQKVISERAGARSKDVLYGNTIRSGIPAIIVGRKPLLCPLYVYLII